MIAFLIKLRQFARALAADPRIPARDKALLGALCVYLASPFDLIPDFLPLVGYLDDLVVAALVLDYIFNVMPEPVVLEHYPWNQEHYRRARRKARWVSRLIPGFARRRLWKQVQTASESHDQG